MRNLIFLLLLGSISTCCYSEQELQPALVGLYVKDIEKSISWYKDTLDFEVLSKDEYPDYELKIAFMKKGVFELELVESKASVTRESLLKTNVSKTSIVGFSKLSFKVSDINLFYKNVQNTNPNFFKELSVSNRNKSNKYFIIMDPDGNLIQFYGENNSIKAN